MAQTNYTPISLYYSTTASAVPTAANLVPGELAINTADGKLYYEDSSGIVQVLATKSTGSIGGSNTQVQFNNSGSLGGSSGLTWDGSFLTTSSIKNSALTSGRVTYAGASGLLSDSANLTFNGSALGVNGTTTIGNQASSGTSGSFAITGVGGAVYLQTGQNTSSASAAPLVFTNSGAANEWMRITSAGNVGIGTSNPSQLLHLNVTSGNVYEQISSGANNVYVGFDSARTVGTIQSNNALTFDVGSSYTPRMTIDTSGNLGLGVTPSTSDGTLVVQQIGQTAIFAGQPSAEAMWTGSNYYYNGGWKYKTTATATQFYTSGGAFYWKNATSGSANSAITWTSPMTLDSSGNLFVGTTALSQAKVGILFDGSISQGFVIRTSLPSSGSEFIRFENSSGTTQGYITALTTTTTSYVGTSDQRLKKNIVDAPSFLSVINSLKVRQFDWKENGETDIGFIAQELHTKLPKTVAVGIDNEDGSIKLPWGVDKSAIIPYLVKAIQEQQALIESLTTRLTALENK